MLSKLEARILFEHGEMQLLVPETKAIEARTFILQGTLEPDNSGGIPEIIENAVKHSSLGPVELQAIPNKISL